jgi:hypothetical protein
MATAMATMKKGIETNKNNDLRTNDDEPGKNMLNTHPLTITPPDVRSKMDQISLEFLLNKKVYKKLIGTNSLQTERENEERKENMIKFRSEILTLFTNMLDNRDNVNVSQEIHSIFDSFIDKSVNYFIRTQKMLDMAAASNEDEDEDDDEDEDYDDDAATAKQQKKRQNFGSFNKHIYGAITPRIPMIFSKKNKKMVSSSNFGDDITFDNN